MSVNRFARYGVVRAEFLKLFIAMIGALFALTRTLTFAEGAQAQLVTAIIPVGSSPDGVAVDPGSHAIYVANAGGGSVSVINGNSNTITATIPVGNSPIGVAMDPSSHTVYVANSGDNTVSVIIAVPVASPYNPVSP
ncbi:MAG TPA: YncE family protein, partial [Chloroflexota bacterium]